MQFACGSERYTAKGSYFMKERTCVRIEFEGQVLKIDRQPIWMGSDRELLDELDRLAKTGQPELIITPNVDQVLNLETVSEFRSIFSGAALRLLDGMPLVLVARAIGAANARRITGADLLPFLVEHAPARDWRIAIVGGASGVASKAARVLHSTSPSSQVFSIETPMLSSIEDARSRTVIADLAEKTPNLVFLGFGSPKQELWFKEWQPFLPPAVYVGTGAAADFIAGVSKRAPTWMQRFSLEWAWRLAQEPRRLAYRYMIKGPRFVRVACGSIWQHIRRLLNPNGPEKSDVAA